jgi:hypothetical protein
MVCLSFPVRVAYATAKGRMGLAVPPRIFIGTMTSENV